MASKHPKGKIICAKTARKKSTRVAFFSIEDNIFHYFEKKYRN
jgi:hypothetical protein